MKTTDEPERLRCLCCGWTGNETEITDRVDVMLDEDFIPQAEVCPACKEWQLDTGENISVFAIIQDDVPASGSPNGCKLSDDCCRGRAFDYSEGMTAVGVRSSAGLDGG